MDGIGSLLGMGLGIGAGALIPGAQPFIPELASLGAGLGNEVQGIADTGKAKKDKLPLEDPYQIGLMNDLKRKQKSLENGTAYQSQQDLVKQAGYKAMDNIVKITGGNIGTTVAALNSAQRATGKNMNELFTEMSEEGFKMDTLMEDLVSKIANRKLQIQGYEKSQANVTAAQEKQNATQMIMGLIAKGGLKIPGSNNIQQSGEWQAGQYGGTIDGSSPNFDLGGGSYLGEDQ
jgi:hypothetical protein